jgi:hypothetical protein
MSIDYQTHEEARQLADQMAAEDAFESGAETPATRDLSDAQVIDVEYDEADDREEGVNNADDTL